MKNLLFKGIALAIIVLSGTTDMAAQGFLKKVNKGLDKVNSVLGSSDEKDGKTEASTPADTITMAGFEADFPDFTVKPTIVINSDGDTLRHEDGSPFRRYLIYDQNDRICRQDTAEVLIRLRKKAALAIAAKIAGGAAGGAAVGSGIGKLVNGKKGAKKGALWVGVAGTVVGTALASGDMKKIREKNKILKELDAALKEYKETFTDEGLPREASADLSKFDSVDPVTRTSDEINDRLAQRANNKEEDQQNDDLEIDRKWDELDKLIGKEA